MFRTEAEILELFSGFELAKPGLVPLADWHRTAPAPGAGRSWLVGGVGRRV